MGIGILQYCYNVIFVFAFTFAISECFRAYGVTGERILKLCGQLFMAYIVESIYIDAIDLFEAGDPLVSLFVSGGYDMFVKMALSCIEVFIMTHIVLDMAGREDRTAPWLMLVFVIMLWACGILFSESAGKVLTYDTYAFALFIMAAVYMYCMLKEKDEEKRRQVVIYRNIMIVMLVCSLLTIAGGFLDIFENFGEVSARPHFTTVADDGFTLIFTVWAILYARNVEEKYMSLRLEEMLQERITAYQIETKEKIMASQIAASDQTRQEVAQSEARQVIYGDIHDPERINEFCTEYSLTAREREIVGLILAGKSNNDICEQLSITQGTAKVHVHNILKKLQLTRRTEILNTFINYSREEQNS